MVQYLINALTCLLAPSFPRYLSSANFRINLLLNCEAEEESHDKQKKYFFHEWSIQKVRDEQDE